MLSRKKRKAFHERILGRTVPVLVENDGEDGIRFGFTDNYVKVGITADSAPGNTIVSVEILHTDDEVCTGRVTADSLAA
jgi:tRNA A37 methylthiotransferase MiaB